MAYVGWEITEADRASLMQIFTPKFPDVIAHHITLINGVKTADVDMHMPSETSGLVVGIAQGDGVECLVVKIAGTITRPTGGTFHITWSIDREAGRKPVDSNRLLLDGYEKLVSEIPITLVPKAFV